MDTTELKKFYELHIPDVLPDSNRRQYRLQLPNNEFIILKKQIRTGKELQKYLIKYIPINVYQSVSSWLNPLNVRHKKAQEGYMVADRILIDNLVFIDIDKKDRAEVVKTLDFFKDNKDYELLRVVDSGGGFHLYFKDLKLNLPAKAEDRPTYVEKRRTALESALIKFGVDLDKGIMCDVFRISRVANTWNNNKDALCSQVAPESLRRGDDGFGSQQIDRKDTRTGVRVPFYYRFISNSVYGVKDLFVPVIKIEKRRDYKMLIRLLQDKYKVGPMYVFEENNNWVIIGIRPFSKRRVAKILKCARSKTLNAFLKYNNIWIRTSSKIDDNKKEIESDLKFIEMFDGEAGTISRPHSHFIMAKAGMSNSSLAIGKKINDMMIASVK